MEGKDIPLSFDPENIIETSDFRFHEMQGVVKDIAEEPGIFNRFSPSQQKVLKFHYLERVTDRNIVEEMKLDTKEDVWKIHDSAIKDLSMLAKCSGAQSLTEKGLVQKLVAYHKKFLDDIKEFRKNVDDEETAKFIESYPSVVIHPTYPTYLSTRDREKMLISGRGVIPAEYIRKRLRKFYSKLK